MEAIGGKSPEAVAQNITSELIKRLGTFDIPFSFRTSNNSVYVTDRHLRTIRYRAASKTFEPISNITVFLDEKYLNPAKTDRSSDQYLPNSLLHENGHLALDDDKRQFTRVVKSFEDLPEGMEVAEMKKALFFVVFETTLQKVIKKAPVTLVPKIGDHPIEFCDPEKHQYRYRNHFGNQIENLTFTNHAPEADVRKAVQDLLLVSLRSGK